MSKTSYLIRKDRVEGFEQLPIPKIDIKEAQQFYLQAGKVGFAMAQFQLGQAAVARAFFGNKIEVQELCTALNWFDLAANNSHPTVYPKHPILLYRNSGELTPGNVSKAKSDLATKLFIETPVAFLLENKDTTRHVLAIANMFLHSKISRKLNFHINAKIRECHFSLGQFYQTHNEPALALKHFQFANVIITFDPSEFTEHYNGLKRQVTGILTAFQVNQNLCETISEYAMPTQDPSRETWGLEQALRTIDLDRIKQEREEEELAQQRAVEGKSYAKLESSSFDRMISLPGGRRY